MSVCPCTNFPANARCLTNNQNCMLNHEEIVKFLLLYIYLEGILTSYSFKNSKKSLSESSTRLRN